MEVTIIGYVLIPLGIVLMFINPLYIYYGMIFLAPFVASSIFNVKLKVSGMQPAFWFGFLWLFSLCIKCIIEMKKYKFNIKEYINNQKKNLNSFQKKFIKYIFIFWIICLLSLLMPILLKDKMMIIYPNSNQLQKLGLKMINITQFIYLTFYILILTSVIFEINKKEVFINSIKVFLYSNLFVTAWGTWQFISYYLKIKYPYYLFNNNICYYQGWNQMIGGIKRVSSVAPEPSMLSLYLLMSIGIIISLWLNKNYIINRYLLNFTLFLDCLCLILTVSTTAYLGFVILMLILLLYNLFFNKNTIVRKRSFIFLVVFIVAIFIVIFICLKIFKIYYGTILDSLKEITINKGKGQSGIQRSGSFIEGYKLFLKSPILGIGWSSVRKLDLLTTLLDNTGLLGCISFIYIIYLSIKNDYYLLANNKDIEIASLGFGFLLSIIMCFLSLGVSIPDLMYLYIWIILGLNINLSKFYGGDHEHRN